jgi:hypothetical protein
MSGITSKETSSTLVKDLEENSSSLENLVADFGKITIRGELKVRCFYETRETQILNTVLDRGLAEDIRLRSVVRSTQPAFRNLPRIANASSRETGLVQCG